MNKTSIATAVLIAGTVIGGSAFADTSRQYRYEIGDLSPDGRYVYTGQENGWEIAPHRLELKNGRWVHTDALDHESPRPVATTKEKLVSQQEPTDG